MRPYQSSQRVGVGTQPLQCPRGVSVRSKGVGSLSSEGPAWRRLWGAPTARPAVAVPQGLCYPVSWMRGRPLPRAAAPNGVTI